MSTVYHQTNICGLFFVVNRVRKYLPQVQMAAHVSILSSVSRTTLTQTFTTTDLTQTLKEVKYAFPIYDGVSVVAFTCTIGDRVVKGVVKEKQQAREVYEQARDRGEAAALLEQIPEAADVWTTSVGNIPPNTDVKVEISYLGELKHDAEVDGVRYTIPAVIAPRYGQLPESMLSTNSSLGGKGGLKIVVDAQVPAGSVIKAVQSPSHPISVAVGNLSTTPKAEPSLRKASATLTWGSTEFDKDFILHVIATNTSDPVALLENHPTLPNQRALMATLVPKFNLPPDRPEIVFVCDRSGSMGWGKIANLKAALHIFLKSLPVGVKFNICSFGSRYSLLWERSRSYDKASLDEASRHVDTFDANMGGTEMCQPIQAVFEKRYKDMNLEVFLLTDGDIWNQENLFGIVNKEVAESNGAVRVFTLGIGTGASTSLVEGVARCGNGFSQLVGDHEKMNNKVVRMLKGALTPHIKDYTLEIKYEESVDGSDEFELVEKVVDCLAVDDAESEKTAVSESTSEKKPISLFNPAANDDTEMEDAPPLAATESKFDHLPAVKEPKLLQAPFEIPPLFPFNRTSVYVLMSDETVKRPVKSVMLRGTSVHGPLELEIPVTTVEEPGETVHQLAARKAVKELEEGKGWIYHAKDDAQKSLKQKYDGRFSDMVEREAVRLGVRYQVAGRWCSFVAVEEGSKDGETRQLTQPLPEVEVESSEDESDNAAPAVYKYRAGGGGPVRVTQVSQAARMAAPPELATRMRARGGGGVCDSTLTRGYDMPDLAARADEQAAQAALFAKGARPSSSLTSKGFGLFGNFKKKASPAPAPPPAPAPAPATAAVPSFSGVSLFGAPTGAAAPPPPPGAPSAFATFGGRASTSALFGAQQAPLPQAGSHLYSAAPGTSFEATKKKAEEKPAGEPLEVIVDLQTFEGFWPASSASKLLTSLGVADDKISAALTASTEPWAEKLKENDDARLTAFVLVYLAKKLASEKDVWDMIAEKALDWLKSVVGEIEQDDLEGVFGKLM
ncbi:hypothetical protein jhhlp_000608 [Lomentospora prolificans]|uniref:VIT domain-containing protein n=1 Tax=Lomentospora prolificans TaxID=41688 RepID=A0A2N3NJ13_9PEZI|nr:hypothetical protein jhhlp_000608 [Lomentospora prolificans]